MDGLVGLFTGTGPATALLLLAIAIALGIALGSLQIRGVGLGVGGVLFAGLALGHLGLGLHPETLELAREGGLVLFVYAIGLQVGPGFFSSLRARGLGLNLLAAAIVLAGTGLALGLGRLAGLDVVATVGLLAGAVTNTPSLGAAQQALGQAGAADAAATLGRAYALAYPFGIAGIILATLALRRLFRVDVAREAEAFARLHERSGSALEARDLELTNQNLAGARIADLADLVGGGVVISRVLHEGRQVVARGDTVLALGDVLHAVGEPDRLERLRVIAGRASAVQVPAQPGPLSVRRVVVTRTGAVGRTIPDLRLATRLGVVVTRVSRAGVEFAPTRDLALQMGDRLLVVGPDDALARAAGELGDEVRELDRTHLLPVFLGIALGLVVGSAPLPLPGVPAPVRLGLAGGPLLVAIALSRVGRVGPFVAYVPNAAKKVLAELGIALFLAAVGLRAGAGFVDVLLTGPGLTWMAVGAAVTFFPLLLLGALARAWRRLDFVSLAGVLSGAMTDPPALAFATQLTRSESPSIAYATVYPLTMLLRVVLAQVIVLIGAG